MNYTIKQKRAYKRFVKGRKQLVHAHKQRYRRGRSMHPMAAAIAGGLGKATAALLGLQAIEGWRATGSKKDNKMIGYYSSRLPGIRDSIREDYEAGKISYNRYSDLRRRINIQISRFNSYTGGKQTGRDRAALISGVAGQAAHVTGSLLPIATDYGLRKELQDEKHKMDLKEIRAQGAESRKYPMASAVASGVLNKYDTEVLFPAKMKAQNEMYVDTGRGIYTGETKGEHDYRRYGGQSATDESPGRHMNKEWRDSQNKTKIVEIGQAKFEKEVDKASQGFPGKTAKEVEKELGGKKKKNTFF